MTLVCHSALKTGRSIGPRFEDLRIQAKCRIPPRLRLFRKSLPPFIPAKPLPANAFFASLVGSADCLLCARPHPMALNPNRESHVIFATPLFSTTSLVCFRPAPGPSSRRGAPAFHRGFSIAERVARRETDETFETLFPPSAPVGWTAELRSASLGLRPVGRIAHPQSGSLRDPWLQVVFPLGDFEY
jgi:hypothetical protein